MYYTTIGSVRGSCGHRHESIETAHACAERDQRGCASQGGHSDRRVVEVQDDTIDPRHIADHEIGRHDEETDGPRAVDILDLPD